VGADDDRNVARLAGESGNGDDRRAFDGKGHRRAAAETEIDAVGGEGLLQLGVAAQPADLDLEPVFFPDAMSGADIQRDEGPGGVDRLCGPHLVEGEGRRVCDGE
jgi:hypothetical protein